MSQIKIETIRAAKQKAEELVISFKSTLYHLSDNEGSTKAAKRCALITVDKIMDVLKVESNYIANDTGFSQIPFWTQVKQELLK